MRFTAITAFHFSSVKCSIGAAFAMPALLTSTSTAPKASTVAADGGLPLLLGRHVEVHESRAIAELGGERRALVVEQVGDDDPARPAAWSARDVRLAEAAGAAGDERDPSVEVDHGATWMTHAADGGRPPRAPVERCRCVGEGHDVDRRRAHHALARRAA